VVAIEDDFKGGSVYFPWAVEAERVFLPLACGGSNFLFGDDGVAVDELNRRAACCPALEPE
jgi:hypothetical protein